MNGRCERMGSRSWLAPSRQAVLDDPDHRFDRALAQCVQRASLAGLEPVRPRRQRVLRRRPERLGTEALHPISVMRLTAQGAQRHKGWGILDWRRRAGPDRGLAHESVIGHQRRHRSQLGRQRAQRWTWALGSTPGAGGVGGGPGGRRPSFVRCARRVSSCGMSLPSGGCASSAASASRNSVSTSACNGSCNFSACPYPPEQIGSSPMPHHRYALLA